MTNAEPPRTDLIVTIRIPKSASTSLAVIVAESFPAARRFCLPNTLNVEGPLSTLQHLRHLRHVARINLRHHGRLSLDRTFQLIDRTARPGDILTGGHIDFDTCRKHLTRKLKLITLVRNPIDRAVSEYAYARAGHARKGLAAKLDAGMIAKAAARYTFEGYLDALLEHQGAFGNIACRYIGLAPHDDIAEHFANHVFHFGTVENLPTFARVLAGKTGNPVAAAHLNRTSGKIGRIVTLAEQRKIEHLYDRDFALHDWCRKHESAPTRAASSERHAAKI